MIGRHLPLLKCRRKFFSWKLEKEKTRRECKGNGINVSGQNIVHGNKMVNAAQQDPVGETACESTCFLGSSLAFYQLYNSLDEQERLIPSQLASDHTSHTRFRSFRLNMWACNSIYIQRDLSHVPTRLIFFSSVSSIIKHYSTIKACVVQHAGLHCLSFT